VEPGEIVAERFAVERRVGAGGMGVVFRDDGCSLEEACTAGVCGPGECDLHLGIGCSDGYYCGYHGHCVSSG
jgi:hypothetical protein